MIWGRRSYIKLLIMLCCAVLLSGYACLRNGEGGQRRSYGWLKQLTRQEYDALRAGREEKKGTDALKLRVFYENNELPYDGETNTFMRLGRMKDGALMIGPQDGEERKADHGGGIRLARLPDGEGFLAYTDSGYTAFQFWETVVPVITLHTQGKEIGSERYEDIGLRVFDERAGRDYCLNMKAGIHTRGASSSWIDKKSYRIKLEEVENRQSKKFGFFGMYPAREWILYSLYGDESKQREKLARDVWAQIEQDSSYAGLGTRLEMEYCEVFLDDEYIGLYGMGTAVDWRNYWQEKSKDSQDLLFKSVNFVAPTPEEIEEADRRTEAVQCLELKYASWRSDDMWRIMGEYMYLAYYAPDDEYISRMKDYMNVDNHIDYWLFFLASGLDDNELKNLYFSITDAGQNSRVLLTPWDMDMAWGVGYTGEDIFMWGRNDSQYKKIMEFPIVSRMFSLQEEEMTALARERWEYLRGGILTEENLLGKIRENHSLIWESGIIERERAKWPEAKYASDVEYIENYVKDRLPYLDKYMERLGCEKES